jgi:hypothetical protein
MKKLTRYRCSYNQLFSVLYIAVSRQYAYRNTKSYERLHLF